MLWCVGDGRVGASWCTGALLVRWGRVGQRNLPEAPRHLSACVLMVDGTFALLRDPLHHPFPIARRSPATRSGRIDWRRQAPGGVADCA